VVVVVEKAHDFDVLMLARLVGQSCLAAQLYWLSLQSLKQIGSINALVTRDLAPFPPLYDPQAIFLLFCPVVR
jgi:hypothetical protein